MYTWLTDSDGPVPAGEVPAESAEASVAVNRAALFAVTLGAQ